MFKERVGLKSFKNRAVYHLLSPRSQYPDTIICPEALGGGGEDCGKMEKLTEASIAAFLQEGGDERQEGRHEK